MHCLLYVILDIQEIFIVRVLIGIQERFIILLTLVLERATSYICINYMLRNKH